MNNTTTRWRIGATFIKQVILAVISHGAGAARADHPPDPGRSPASVYGSSLR